MIFLINFIWILREIYISIKWKDWSIQLFICCFWFRGEYFSVLHYIISLILLLLLELFIKCSLIFPICFFFSWWIYLSFLFFIYFINFIQWIEFLHSINSSWSRTSFILLFSCFNILQYFLDFILKIFHIVFISWFNTFILFCFKYYISLLLSSSIISWWLKLASLTSFIETTIFSLLFPSLINISWIWS